MCVCVCAVVVVVRRKTIESNFFFFFLLSKTNKQISSRSTSECISNELKMWVMWEKLDSSSILDWSLQIVIKKKSNNTYIFIRSVCAIQCNSNEKRKKKKKKNSIEFVFFFFVLLFRIAFLKSFCDWVIKFSLEVVGVRDNQKNCNGLESLSPNFIFCQKYRVRCENNRLLWVEIVKIYSCEWKMTWITEEK